MSKDGNVEADGTNASEQALDNSLEVMSTNCKKCTDSLGNAKTLHWVRVGKIWRFERPLHKLQVVGAPYLLSRKCKL